MKTCLIADEAPIICKVASRIVELHDYTADFVQSGEELREALAKSMPDLLIIADRLGDERGVEIVKDIREMRGGRLPTILICASENGIAARSRIRRSGANGLVVKPFTNETMEVQLARLGLTRTLAA